MIEIIEQAVRDDITTMDWVDRYGGLVTRVMLQEENEKKYYPVSCFVDAENCFENGMYKDMVPDSSKKSVLYFEQLDTMNFIESIDAKDRVHLYQTRIRLVIYINLVKNGMDTPCQNLLYLPNIIRAMVGKRQVLSDHYKNSIIEIKPPEINLSDQIFARYTYDETFVENLKLYPHQYYALDFDVDIYFDTKCHTYDTLKPEIVCQQIY